MRRAVFTAFAVGLITTLTAGTAAAACVSKVYVQNMSQTKALKVLSCYDQKKGSNAWREVPSCGGLVASGDLQVLKPTQGKNVKMPVLRKPNQEFRLRITYEYTDGSGVGATESNFATCKAKNHWVLIHPN